MRRTLVPSAQGDADAAISRYVAGADYAAGPWFSFVGLPAGEYELEIVADGHFRHVSRHRVVPGRPPQLAPVVLTRREH